MNITIADRNHHLVGICFKITNSFTFTIMSFLMVKFSGNLFAVQEFFFIAFFGAIITFTILKSMGQNIDFKLNKREFILFSIRGLTSFISIVSWIEAIKNLGINEAMSLSYATPLWLLMIAIITCKEKAGLRDVIIIALNTLGMIAILKPQIDKITWMGFFAAMLTTMLWAIHDTSCKKLSEKQEGKNSFNRHSLNLQRTFFSFLFSALISLPFALYFWEPVNITHLAGFALISMVASINLTVLFLAYVYAPIVLLVPVSYTRLVIASSLSYLLYNTAPSSWCFVGAGLIVTANLYFYISRKKVTNG